MSNLIFSIKKIKPLQLHPPRMNIATVSFFVLVYFFDNKLVR